VIVSRRYLPPWVLLAALLFPWNVGTASAQATLISGLGGTANYGTQCLGPNDDGSSRSIDLTAVFPAGIRFFDRTHTQMFVNTNGNVTFSAGVPTYTPSAFPVADQPMIAPFWADVDIRTDPTDCAGPGGGEGYAGDCENPASNGVWWNVDTANSRIVVTWDRVGYYSCKVNRVMSFQLVLTPAETESCGGGDFDVEFRYNRCEWNTGDASGGSDGLQVNEACVLGFCPSNPGLPCVDNRCFSIPAQAGFDAGNTTDYVEIMGSRTNTIHTTLCGSSNVGETGIWRYQIRSGVVICPGAGAACETGMPGVCGAGRMQCVGGGTECRAEVTASDERCDSLDNDCDGNVDEGEAICGAREMCVSGSCVSSCFEGGCASGQVCTAAGRCVEAGCEAITCPSGQRCSAGACVGACDGITCPHGLDCRGGRCVDLCAGAACDDCTICEAGACEPRCPETPCGAGEACQEGRCVESSCATVTCPAGQFCRAGACTDACTGAMCPTGEICQLGMCVPEERPDAGPSDIDAGPIEPGTDAGETEEMDASSTVDIDGGRGRDRTRPSGCGCRVDNSPVNAPLPLFLLALFGIIAHRRRRHGR
jgi:MYXO-CTERM domain-containing protein